jgi:FlaA1/EpsC-like NDP-sugar epimerase
MLDGLRLLVTGGTGSLGQALIRRVLTGEMGMPDRIIIFSRGEVKQHEMRLAYAHKTTATDEIIYHNAQERLEFHIGDVRDYAAIAEVVSRADVIINAAALKQVPVCEYYPFEAVQTNILGVQNLIRAVRGAHVRAVVGVSSDKACQPINVYGMSKAIQERMFAEANLNSPTRFVCVRYGNVIASRGSVIPLFLDQIARGGPLTITTTEMTRFLLDLDQAVDTVLAAIRSALPGETYVPQVPSARIIRLAHILRGERKIDLRYIGIRPGEKVHEILVSEEECERTIERDGYYVICPMLPELQGAAIQPVLHGVYSSENNILGDDALRQLLEPYLP